MAATDRLGPELAGAVDPASTAAVVPATTWLVLAVLAGAHAAPSGSSKPTPSPNARGPFANGPVVVGGGTSVPSER